MCEELTWFPSRRRAAGSGQLTCKAPPHQKEDGAAATVTILVSLLSAADLLSL